MNSELIESVNLLNSLSDDDLRSLSEVEQRELVSLLEWSEERQQQVDCERSFYAFVRAAWTHIEAAPFIDNWHIGALCEHLQAVTEGQIEKLLWNCPPGLSKPCYNGGMILERTKGRIELGTVAVGDFVLTHRGRFREVTAVHQQGVLPLLEFKTATGRLLRVAHDHPLLTARGWIEARHVTTADVLAIVMKTEACGTETMTLQEARLLGYLIGDGCIKFAGKTLTNQDQQTIEDFRQCAETIGFKTRTAIRQREGYGPKFVVSLLGGQAARTGAAQGAKGLFGPVRMWLQRHNLEGKGSYDKRVPQAILGGSDEIVAEFLAAYWACDGGIQDRRDVPRSGRVNQKENATRIDCCSVSEGLARDIQHLLTRLGLSFTLYRHTTTLKTNVQGDTYVSWRILSTSQDTAAKFMQIFRHRLRHEKSTRAVGLERSDFDRVLVADTVREITAVEPGECRCLTVDEDSSFAYQDLAVHNSLLTSVFWPAWEWTLNPTIRFFSASYDQRLSTRDSVRCRSLLDSLWYQRQWPIKLRGDQNLKTYYETQQGGWRLATSIGGHGTGEHPHRIVIDDPSSVSGAESVADREEVKTWWTMTMPTRGVTLNVRKVAIMQRTHREDFSSLALEEGGWTHVCLPMRYERDRMKPTPLGWTDPRTVEGELLAPVQFPEEKVASIEKTLRLVHGNYGVASQLQQRPDLSGNSEWPTEYFGPHIWFDEWPPSLQLRILSLDPSKGKSSKYGDYCAFVLLGRDREGIMWVEADLRRVTSEVIVSASVEHTGTFRPDGFAVETNTFQELFIALFLQAVDPNNPQAQAPGLHMPIYQINNSVNKEVRIRRLGPYLGQRQFRFKANSPGTKLLVQQLKDFPLGDHDDGPDALEQGVRLAVQIWNNGK